jgi:hypothetical protein
LGRIGTTMSVPAAAMPSRAASPFDGLAVWVVHCRHLMDRRTACLASLRGVGLDARWMEWGDPEDLGLGYWLGRVRQPRLTRGQVSVYAKQLAVWRQIAGSAAPALVLEDDPVFPPGFAERFASYLADAPPAWDLLFLGASCGLEAPADPGRVHWARASRTRSLSGYLITADAAARLHAALERLPIQRPVDHAVDAIAGELGLRLYWSVPALIENGTETGRFQSSLRGGAWRRRDLVRWLSRVLPRW